MENSQRYLKDICINLYAATVKTRNATFAADIIGINLTDLEPFAYIQNYVGYKIRCNVTGDYYSLVNCYNTYERELVRVFIHDDALVDAVDIFCAAVAACLNKNNI